jgi:hypothetical protein
MLTVISPLPKNIKEDLFGKVIPFERHVTRLLSTGLSATVEATEYALRQANTDHFRDAAGDGVSANLLDAIIGLMGPSHREVNIKFAWSPELPIIASVRPIEFNPEFVPVMEQASRFLKQQEPMPPVEIVGVATFRGLESGHRQAEAYIRHLQSPYDLVLAGFMA